MKYTSWKPSGVVRGYIHLSASHFGEYTLRPPLQVLQLVYFMKKLEYLQCISLTDTSFQDTYRKCRVTFLGKWCFVSSFLLSSWRLRENVEICGFYGRHEIHGFSKKTLMFHPRILTVEWKLSILLILRQNLQNLHWSPQNTHQNLWNPHWNAWISWILRILQSWGLGLWLRRHDPLKSDYSDFWIFFKYVTCLLI